MSKQTKPIDKQCQSKSQCEHAATIGVYAWRPGESDVNLDKPVRVFCGAHKPRWTSPNQTLRNVKLLRTVSA